MKSKKLIWAFLPLSAAMILASCGTDTPTPEPSYSENPTTSEVGTSELPSSSDTSSQEGEVITHRQGLNKALAEGAVTRAFDKRFDIPLEDFSGESLLGTSNVEIHKGILREVVDSNLDSFQKTPGAAIYKMASASFGGEKTLLGQGSVHFKMRVVEGKLPMKDLIFGIRPSNDADANIYPINMGEALNADEEANPELTNEFQDISINIGASVGDENTLFPGTELKVLSEAVGFHLYVKEDAEVSAVVEIAEVSFQKGDNATVIDDFSRQEIGGNPNVYWGPTDCADAVLIRRGLALGKGQNYTTPEITTEKSHIVLSALGDLSHVKMTVAYNDEASTVKTASFPLWKAQGDKAVVNAVDGAYANLAIDLDAFGGVDEGHVKTVTLENEGDNVLEISNVFLTSFEEPELDKKYPSINPKTAVTFDNFERTFASLDGNYDASHADSRNVDAGIYHFLSYNHGDKIYTKDGVLHMPGTEAGNKDDYDHVGIGSSHVLKGAKYLVFSIKGEEGTDLNGFRFKMGDMGKENWFNSVLAMEGVKTYGDAAYQTPYTTAEGFSWYIVDLAQNGLEAGDNIHMYYTGEKDIEIDSIFYANDFNVYQDAKNVINDADVDLNAYHRFNCIHASSNSSYLYFKAKGDGVANFDTFRLEMNGKQLFFKDGLKLYDKAGSEVSSSTLIPEEETTYYAPLSAFPEEGDGWVHFHSGEYEEKEENKKPRGKISVSEIGIAEKGFSVDGNAATDCVISSEDEAAGWKYISGWTSTVEAKKMIVHVSGDADLDLSLFRVKRDRNGEGAEFWANQKPLLKTLSGEDYDINAKLSEEGVDLVLDFASAGMDVQVGDAIHFFTGGKAGTIHFGTAKAIADEMPAGMATSAYVQTWAK